jgi:hypothetical protein
MTQAGYWKRSVVAVLAGLVLNVVLALGTDQIFHATGVYPGWGQRMADRLFLLALAYRLIYGGASGMVAAWLAPRAPVAHALVLGGVGCVAATAGAIAAAASDLGPGWYTWGLAASAIPTAWLGGLLDRRRRAAGGGRS